LSAVDHNIELSPRISEADVADYIALLKPRVMSLVVFTALVGLMIAPVHVHPVLAFTSILCIAVGAGASGALNMWYESDIDALMSRTVNRPIPRGRVTRPEALTFGMILAFFSVMTLGILVNWFAGALLAFTIFFYVVIYTIALKRWTAQNIVIGVRPARCLRWWRGRRQPARCQWSAAAVPNHLLLDPAAFLGAGSVPQRRLRARRCADAAGGRRSGCDAAADIALYHGAGRGGRGTLALGYFDAVYGIASLVLGSGMLLLAIQVYRHREGVEASRATRKLFAFSILYLFALFATLGLEVVAHAVAPLFG